MTQHLKACKQRKASFSVSSGEEKTNLFHLVVEGTYAPDYWMHLEMPADLKLDDLDMFLRKTWVECCGHLSAFTINGVSYNSYTDWFEEIEEDGVVSEDGDRVESDGEDENALSEVPTEQMVAELLEILEAEFQAKLSDLSPDEFESRLVNLLESRSQIESGAPLPPESLAQIRALAPVLHMMLINDIELEDLEEPTMGARLESVLKLRQKFSYEYDFGSTTYLTLRVVGEREGVRPDEELHYASVQILARNEPPVFLCRECGKPATKILAGYFDVNDGAICDACAEKQGAVEFDGEWLPIVNSPRVGVCGYTGDEDEDEWEEEDEEELAEEGE
ncbi:MAG TPA: hypothetical protein VKR42_04800 [Ktedonobacteraceae bacterium]|nr:hypothetical protein [Ktedonobacteraceae bacterium]